MAGRVTRVKKQAGFGGSGCAICLRSLTVGSQDHW